jgi:hypothetical protein
MGWRGGGGRGGEDIYRTTRAPKRQVLNYSRPFTLVPPTLGMRVLACACCRYRNENNRFRNAKTGLGIKQLGLGMGPTG